MPHPLWILHFLFWWPFVIRGQVQRASGTGAHLGRVTHRHPRAALLVAAHTVPVGLSMAGLALGTRDGAGRALTGGLVVGTLLIILGAGVARWTLHTFRSWRLRAEITEHHQLSTDGPFAWVRHPIYLAMNLLMLGTCVWIPNAWTMLGFVGTAVVSDLRARGEERVLLDAFGEAYAAYMGRVRRFLPRVY